MKLLPLIGAIILSAAPVHTSNAFREIIGPCERSKKAKEACLGLGLYLSSISGYTLLCSLREAGDITPEVFAAREEIFMQSIKLEREYEKVMYNQAIIRVQENFPDCPI